MNIPTMGFLCVLLIVCGVLSIHLSITSPTIGERWAWIAGAFSFSAIGITGLVFSIVHILWSGA